MQILPENSLSIRAQQRLVVISKKLKSREKALGKRTFNKSKAAKEQELKPLCDELEQVFTRSYPFKIEVVMDCDKRLIEAHLDENPRAILSISDKVLKNIAEHTDIEIAAHPSDAVLLTSSLSETALHNASGRNFVVMPDESMKRGSLVVKADKSIIDAHLSTQLGRAQAILLT